MPDDLSRLYDTHAQALYAFLLRLTRHEADTRDVLQEVFCKLARKPSMLDGVLNERAFLLRIAHRIAIDQSRSRTARSRRDEIASHLQTPENPGPGQEGDEATVQAALEEAVDALPDDQRVVVHLKLRTGLTFAEIAEVMSIPPNTAASRYRYAIDKLRERLRPLYEELQ